MPTPKYEMLNTKWELIDQKQMKKLLAQAPVGHLGLYDGEETYVVPYNFAYKDNQIYMHSAFEGRKIDIMRQNPRVCFTVDEFLGYDPTVSFTSYRSVMCFGAIRLLASEDASEYLEALNAINQKYEPGAEMNCKSDALVICLDIDVMTGREKLQTQ